MQNSNIRIKPGLLFQILLSILFISNLTELFAQSAHSDKTKKNHSENKKTNPNYNLVFPQNKVNRLDITIKAEDWQKITASLTAKLGKPNTGFGPGAPPPDMFHNETDRMGFPDSMRMGPPDSMRMGPPDSMRMQAWDSDSTHHMPPGGDPMHDNHMGPPPGMMGPASFSNLPDIFVPATIGFEGKLWSNTGFRFKGNSSLMMSWNRGIKKMPFRLNFGKYGDSIPELKKQKFYGFKELSFSNNMSDNSFMCEKVANDLFREAGLNVPQTAFYEIYIDFGQGPVYFGLYTTMEIVEDTMLGTQFGSNEGNCYKPDGQAGSFAKGTYDKESFVKKNHRKKADWSDISKLYTILNSETRVSNPNLWKIQMDSIFDIPAFLKWLAVNNTIQNWDTYGSMPHNYYLYNNPATNKLTWIPWDNNEALSSPKNQKLTFSLAEIKSNWPLIRYLLDQPEYAEFYKAEINKFIAEVFNPALVKEKTRQYFALIQPFVLNEKTGYTFLSSPKNFEEAKNKLNLHVEKRYLQALDYLKK